MFGHGDRGLFAEIGFFEYRESTRQAIIREVDGLDANRLLNTTTDDLVAYFEQKYRREPPRLIEDKAEASAAEVDIDISRDRNRMIFDRGQPFMVRGLAVTYHVPFEGDAECFRIQPASQHLVCGFRGQIVGQELQLRFQGDTLTSEQLRQEFAHLIGQYRLELDGLRNDLTGFNNQIANEARGAIEGRKQKLMHDRSLTARLGVPIRARPDVAKTYAAPEVRRRIAPTFPPASSAPFTPEPALTDEQYEHVLRVVHSSLQVMERSPQAFKTMDEETLRTQILVQLNGHFEGQATAETFNAAGKTDILIRSGDRNIFIAECKIWSGPEALLKAIDQLLGYTAWRDTKTAIILFNRNKDFSAVLDKINPTMKQHANFKRALPKPGETSWRYVFGHRDDSGRELLLTVLAFDIPAAD
jgi:hypothetical protein